MDLITKREKSHDNVMTSLMIKSITACTGKKTLKTEETEHRKADRTVWVNCFVFSNISSGTACLQLRKDFTITNETYLIERGQTLEPKGINEREEI